MVKSKELTVAVADPMLRIRRAAAGAVQRGSFGASAHEDGMNGKFIKRGVVIGSGERPIRPRGS